MSERKYLLEIVISNTPELQVNSVDRSFVSNATFAFMFSLGENRMERKRSLISIEQGNLASFVPKRSKTDDLFNFSKERKENIGDKISALQQLVSPYGKTDTASVLLEAMEYITFLHEQVKVLSAPYLLPSNPMNKLQEGDDELYSLRSKGLYLVPIAYTVGVAGSNGADIWAPIKTTTSSRF